MDELVDIYRDEWAVLKNYRTFCKAYLAHYGTRHFGEHVEEMLEALFFMASFTHAEEIKGFYSRYEKVTGGDGHA